MFVSVQDQCCVTSLLLRSWFSLPDEAQFCHRAWTCGWSHIMLAVSVLCQGAPVALDLGKAVTYTTQVCFWYAGKSASQGPMLP